MAQYASLTRPVLKEDEMPFDSDFFRENEVYRSWIDNPFHFVLATKHNNQVGLRKPQLAALYTVLGHLISSPEEPGTIVMPTGTGKTDAIFAMLIAGKFKRTLIIVPSDNLRTQFVEKINRLDTLRKAGVINARIISPVTKTISGKIASIDIDNFIEANVLVATPQAILECDDLTLQNLISLCSHLVIDEAHHVSAATWARIKHAFVGKPILQFTATPFREDKQGLGGRIVYNYPMRDAQADGYFQSIEFHPIREYQPSRADVAIARKAVELLNADLDAGFDHLMMVRAKTKIKANKLFDIYKEFSHLNPIVIHSDISGRAHVLENIRAKKHRIIICVDMLGEGFDLPELKIAAIHDQHRSPAVTLQFIGRMTRTDPRLGSAKFVANIANQRIGEQMSALYEESADWSAIIREISTDKITREVAREEFAAEFEASDGGKQILALNPWPKISAVAYRLDSKNWQPSNAEFLESSREEVRHFSVNDAGNLVVLVTRATVPVDWAKTAEISNTEWYLYMAYFKPDEQTMFLSCSGNEVQATRFLKLIANNYARIAGEPTFRILHELDLVKLQNVGLSRSTRGVQFTMHVGRDINSVMDELENGTAIKSNIFATGYESGSRATAGCSHKGKLWEMTSESLDYWVKWCDKVSRKINNANINTEEILNNVMRAERINGDWPDGMFFADWPDQIFIEDESRIYLFLNGSEYPLIDLILGPPRKIKPGIIAIDIFGESDGFAGEPLMTVTIKLLVDSYTTSASGAKLSINGGTLLSDYLDQNPLRLLRVDGSLIYGNYRFFSPSTLDVKLPRELIVAWNWGGTKIQNESMGKAADSDTVQGFTSSEISHKYHIVFNDDGNGEVADLVGVNETQNSIEVSFYHCKYCPSKAGIATPGARVGDTYEVSGQASRSVKWSHSGEALFSRLIERYTKSMENGFDRILKGKIEEIDALRYKSRDKELKISFFIVQPAIAASQISDAQLAVLGTSYRYIKGITGSELRVIVSDI